MKRDKVVLPYAKMPSEHPRRCIFFGTINPGETGYLTDATGNRRYWPVVVTKADLEAIDTNRDQIWAEAVLAYENGERWWLEGREQEDLARAQTAAREEYDVWDEILTQKLIGNGHRTTTIAEALQAIGVPNERMTKREMDRVAKCLRRIGYISRASKQMAGDGKRKSVMIFERPDP